MGVFQILFLLFIAIPLLEIYLLIQVGGLIGAMPTVLLVVFTAVLGVGLLRLQGLQTLHRVQTSLARGELPTVAMLEGAVLLVAGALLLTPGFFTDAIGFLALVPPLRRAIIVRLLERGVIQTHPGGGSGRGAGPRSGHRTLEGDYTRDDDRDR